MPGSRWVRHTKMVFAQGMEVAVADALVAADPAFHSSAEKNLGYD